MKAILAAVAWGALTMAAASASAATTFTAEAAGNTVRAFSFSDKPMVCSVTIHFSILYQGERHSSMTLCRNVEIKVGDHLKICEFSHERVIEPKIEKPVEAECG